MLCVSNNIASETIVPIPTKFHLKVSMCMWKEFCSNGSCLLKKMGDMPIYLKGLLKKILLLEQWTNNRKLKILAIRVLCWYIKSGISRDRHRTIMVLDFLSHCITFIPTRRYRADSCSKGDVKHPHATNKINRLRSTEKNLKSFLDRYSPSLSEIIWSYNNAEQIILFSTS